MSARETRIPSGVKWLFVPLLLATGGLVLAVALGLIEIDPAGLHAPLWIVGAIGLAFAAMGLVLLADGVQALRRAQGLLGFVCLVSFAAVFNWIAFGPGERHFSTRTGVGTGAFGVTTAAEGGEFGGRFVFGVVAVLLDLLIVSPLIVWLWRRRRAAAPSDS